jgi:hypothetical protein
MITPDDDNPVIADDEPTIQNSPAASITSGRSETIDYAQKTPAIDDSVGELMDFALIPPWDQSQG